MLELGWVPHIIKKEYSMFLAFALYKVFETASINISTLPGRTSADNDAIVLYVSPETNLAVVMSKFSIGDKGNFK